jgi:hypothetical protein
MSHVMDGPGVPDNADRTVLPVERAGGNDGPMAILYASIHDKVLQNAVVALLGRIGDGSPVQSGELQEAGPGEIVVTSTSDCTLARCAALAAQGAKVILLASLPSVRQREAYLAAGASAYLPMVLDHAALAEAIKRAHNGAHCDGKSR